MKRTLTMVVTLLILTAATQAQSLQKFYEKYGSDERFEYVSINKGMMNMGAFLGGMSKSDKNELEKMQGLKILTFSGDTEQAFVKAMIAELDQIVKTGGFESAVEVREKGERVNIYFRVVETNNSDMLIITREKNEFTSIWIKGKMTKEDMMNTFSSTMPEGIPLAMTF